MTSDILQGLMDKLHEKNKDLRIHQIELEMQNEELRRTQYILAEILATKSENLVEAVESAKAILIKSTLCRGKP